MAGEPDVTDLVERLEVVAEELGDRALGALRAAVQEGATTRPDVERRLMRARRSVEKAASILRERNERGSGDDLA